MILIVKKKIHVVNILGVDDTIETCYDGNEIVECNAFAKISRVNVI